MRILIVCSGNTGLISPFVSEQVDSLKKFGIDFSFYLIKGKGLFGYIKNIRSLNKKIAEINPDIIHAHYGLSGFLANFQRKIPVVVTLHGSDLNEFYLYPISKTAVSLSRHAIIVSEKMLGKSKIRNKISIIPCGIPFESYEYISKEKAREILHLDSFMKYVLFSSSFNNKVKNSKLAFKSLKFLKENIELLELSGRTRNEVRLLLYACDVALLTSFSEGSPQFIKEAMVCGCPIVSTNVGDVSEILNGIKGCYLTTFSPLDVSDKLKKALLFNKRTSGRQRIIDLGLDSDSIAAKVVSVYHKLI